MGMNKIILAIIVLLSALALAACYPLFTATDAGPSVEHPIIRKTPEIIELPLDGLIQIKTVGVSDRFFASGTALLPDGLFLRSQLFKDGVAAAWWPSEMDILIEDSKWQIDVPLGTNGAPENLRFDEGYVLRVWFREDSSINAVWSYELAQN
jgi:hypothetical protein